MFSIIVPVYNVQRFLPLCIKSLTNQSYDNFEIICINDGSTDNSKELLEQYAKADARITVINQKNKGLGGARNTGVRAANGTNCIDENILYKMICSLRKKFILKMC